ncbi:MAG: ECF transporter S component [Lachnospiraceae bacterium]
MSNETQTSKIKEQDNQQKRTGRLNTGRLVLIAMLGGISAVLMLFEFAVPFVPPFIELDFSELAIIIGGFVMGPVEGLLIILIKILLNLVMNGTTTMGVGELMNFCVSAFYMVPSVLIYRKLRTRKGAAISLLCGTLTVSILATLTNYFIMFPIYAWAYKMPMEALVQMGSAVNPHVNSLFTMMLWAVLPFNLFKYTLVSIITFLVYKRLAGFLRNTILK